MSFPFSRFEEAFRLLDERMAFGGFPPVKLVVCGGAALMATHLGTRQVTKDVDVVALLDEEGRLIDPEPLPDFLLREIAVVADTLSLPKNWLNNGPSRGDGGIFRLGLPEQFVERLSRHDIGSRVTLFFIGRYDQIHFKLYAAVDRSGGYHADDLMALAPTGEELLAAARWAMTHDPSEGFRDMMIRLLRGVGFDAIAEKI